MKPISFASFVREAKPGWPASIPVPATVASALLGAGARRFVCTVGAARFSCALASDGEGRFVHLSARLREEAGVEIGQRVRVTLAPDVGRRGETVPEELTEVLRQEPGARDVFEALTPGRQRAIAALVLRARSSDARITKAIRLVEALLAGERDLRALARASSIRAGSR